MTIIHPSRSRPKIAYQTALRWIERIGLPEDQFEYILSLDNDDLELWSYKNKFPCLNFTIFRAPNRSAIDAINLPAKFYSVYRGQEPNSKDFLIVISDDFDCPDNWGTILISLMRGETDWILKTNDGIQEWIITLPIMDWIYYRRFNYIYHPAYEHSFSDTEMSLVADLLKRRTFSPIMFTHRPDGPLHDEVSKKADATFESGKKIFIERKAKNFDLKPEEIIGTCPENVYTRMQ